MKRLLALLLCCLLLPTAHAEQNVLAQVQPLVDLTATAVMLTGEEISPEHTMSDALVQCILRAGLEQELGYTDFDLNNIAWRDNYLAAHYAVPFGLTKQVAELERYAFYGVRPMTIDESGDGGAMRILGDVYQADGPLETLTNDQYAKVQWLDRRAVVELRYDASAGWRLSSFALDAEWEMEQAAQDYFTQAMAEYVNGELGFSIQYPAVFGDGVEDTANGICGRMEGATFTAERVPNSEGWTTESLLESIKQESPEVETNINTITGYGRVVAASEKEITVSMYVATEDYVYQVHLAYDPALSKDFSLYSDYMMNSFAVDELGQG